MANQNKQSVTISFTTTSGDGISLSVDMDDEKNKEMNNDRTSGFLYGDEAFFRVFTVPILGVTLSCFPSDGLITSYGTFSTTVTEILVFSEPVGSIEKNTASLSKPCVGSFVATQLSPTSCGVISVDPDDPTKVVASLKGPGAYMVSYQATYSSFSLQKASPPAGWPPAALIPEDESDVPYPIVVIIVGV